MRRSMRGSLALLTLPIGLIVAAPAAAKKNDPNIHLEYKPQQAVAAVEAVLTSDMLSTPVVLAVVEGRTTNTERIGTRTDDDDRRVELRATNEVTEFVRRAAEEAGRQWGLQLAPSADLVLELAILKLHVLETNQAVGASYNAEAQFEVTLSSRHGGVLHTGPAIGDASRYGKKYSADNVNEVLSDAVLEAFGDALSDRGLQDGWAKMPGPERARPAIPAAPAPPVSPAELLAEVQKLIDRDLSADTLVPFIEGKTLSAPFAAEDLIAWKEAGVPESVLQAAMRLPVR